MDNQDRESLLSGSARQGQDDVVGQPQPVVGQPQPVVGQPQIVYPQLSVDGSFGDTDQEHERLSGNGREPKTVSHQGQEEQLGLMVDRIQKFVNYTRRSEADRRTEAREREEEDERRAADRERDRQNFKYEIQQDSMRLGTVDYQNMIPLPVIPKASTTADHRNFPGQYADNLSKEAHQRDQQDMNTQAMILESCKQAHDVARTKQLPTHQRQNDILNNATRSRWVSPLEDSTDRQEIQSKQVYKMLLLTKTKKMTREDLHSFDSWRNSLLNNILASGVLPTHTWCRFVCHLWVYGLLQ